jgi:chromosome segregation ATPase
MAGLTPEEQKQINELLKKQVELQAEGYGLSSSYLESLKEILGIRSRQTTTEANVLSINKQINKEILNQKFASSDINELQKQIKKNQDLINKAKIQEADLTSSLSEKDKNRINQASIKLKAIDSIQKELDVELSKSKEEQELNKDHIQSLQERLSKNEKYLQTVTENMSQSARILFYTQKQREELEKQNEARKEELKTLNTIGKAISDGLKDTKLGKMKGQIVEFLQNPMSFVKFLVIEVGKTFLDLDKGISDFAKSMNLSYQDAAKLNNEFNNIANSSMDVAVTTKGIRESMAAIGKSLGSNAILNAKDAVAMTKFREQAGLAQDELNEMQKLSLATGTSLEDNVATTLYSAKITGLNNKVLLNEKQIMSEVAKASAATKLSLANNPEALAKAAAQAKALGMNLEQVNKIADGLLEIESSISNELEAELLTGKNLNLEQARLYALNNDMEGLSREIAKNFGSAAEFSKMNRIQQEAAAKAVGMSREELAATLTDQEALKNLSGKQAEDAQAALNAARARGMTEEEIKKKNVDGLLKQQSIQERFNQSIEKLQELLVSLVSPLMPVLDIFTGILGVVGKIVGFLGNFAPAILAGVAAIKLYQAAQKRSLLMSIGEAAMGAIKSLSSIPIVGWALGLAAAGTVAALGMKYSQGNDVVSPGYGKRTLMGPEGAIALNDKDTVIAGTNLFDKKGDDVISEPEKITGFKPEGAISATSSGGQIDYNALASAVVSALKNAPMTVNSTLMLDKDVLAKQTIQAVSNNATKVGTAAAVGTSKI